jgi:hypothetical protein
LRRIIGRKDDAEKADPFRQAAPQTTPPLSQAAFFIARASGVGRGWNAAGFALEFYQGASRSAAHWMTQTKTPAASGKKLTACER